MTKLANEPHHEQQHSPEEMTPASTAAEAWAGSWRQRVDASREMSEMVSALAHVVAEGRSAADASSSVTASAMAADSWAGGAGDNRIQKVEMERYQGYVHELGGYLHGEASYNIIRGKIYYIMYIT